MRTITPQNARLVPPEAKLVFQGVIFSVYQWQQKMFDGTSATFEMLKRPDTVQTIAVKGDKIVVLEEEQPGTPPYYGLPGGRHDHDDESEVEAARREMAEETGLTFARWKLLSVRQPHSKIEQLAYTFLATEFQREVPQQLDNGEKIEVSLLTFDEVKKLVHHPRGRYLAKDIFDQVQSLDELLALPEYKA